MKERKNNVNTLLWLMVTLSAMMMFSLVCLSSCNSSVNSNGKGGKTPDDPPVPKITVTYSCSNNNGTIEAKVISSKEGKIEGNKIINLVSGDKIQFTAKPNNGYKFKEWIPKELGNKETFELTVDKDLSVSVEFEKDPSTMTELEFLEYKIGFNKESEVVYGKDVSQEQLKIEAENKANGKEYAIYTADSLGFGKAEAGEICYHGYNSYKDSIVSMTVEEELNNDNRNDNGNDLKKLGITENFKSIHDGLEKRWMAVHKGTLGNSLHYYNANETPDSIARSLISTIGGSYDFGLSSDKEDYKLYMWANSASKYSYYMDLRIAFVKKDEPDKGYSVHFANVKNGKYEPYVLHNAGDSKYTEYPPGAEPKYTESTEEGMRMFRLSSLLKTSLENLHKKESKEWKYSEQDLVDALLKEVKDKNYDIYIIFGCVSNMHNEEYSNSRMTVLGMYWCNVLKFGDSFWEKLETKKP